MAKPGDTLVLFLLIGVILYFIIRQIPLSGAKWGKKEEEPVQIKGEVPDLLRAHGFEVMHFKERVPLVFGVDDAVYESRIFIDYIARREDELYVVVVARDRKPLRMSGAGLRDFFLPYYLLVQPDGILYVDKEKKTVKVVHLEIPELTFSKKSRRKWPLYATAVVLLLFIIWLVQ
ncbi:hypothetical protein H1164_08620 [Thermoactinomyces daqus]|uniref:Uncharacterized protein n=1 Tax=Thermoactinomyces daqus TaxID=1329516 RepID=A0A7W1XA82_9BACL|nr:hypothetical protein [Thermoactinomyces daqus]MBA4542965.1 hypothetical protein [Thermoactinomyces daqus]